MAVGALFKFARDAFFSKPSVDRQLIKLARKQRVRRVVELGLASLEQTQSLLQGLVHADPEGIAYCAIDPFEQRADGESVLTLIEAHRVLSSVGAAVRLTPGLPDHALAGIANSLADTDLIILPGGLESERQSPIWFYLPRMCHPGTLVVHLDESDPEAPEWRQWPLAEIEARAAHATAQQPTQAAA